VTRAVNLTLDESAVVSRCLSEKIGVSAIEPLPGGGVRMVCKSTDGAALIRKKLKRYLMDDAARREPHRPATGTW